MNKSFWLSVGLSFFSIYAAFCQDSISNKFHVQAGVEIIPGLTLGWESKDYKIFNHNNDREDGYSINSYFITYGASSDFYFNRLIVSAGALISVENFFAYVSPHYQGHYILSTPHYELDYSASYLDFPLSVGWAFNKNAGAKKTFISAGVTISFMYYERNYIYNSSSYYLGSGPLLSNYTKHTYNKDVITRKIKYNRTCVLFTVGRETQFIKNTPIYFKRALTIFTAPIDVKRYTTEIFTSARLGIELGFNYRIK